MPHRTTLITDAAVICLSAQRDRDMSACSGRLVFSANCSTVASCVQFRGRTKLRGFDSDQLGLRTAQRAHKPALCMHVCTQRLQVMIFLWCLPLSQMDGVGR